MTSRLHVARSLRPFGETIFSEITRLAHEHDAINLGQGFPNFDGPDHVKDAAAEAMRAGHNQYPPSPGIPELRQAIAAQARERGLDYDERDEVTVTSGCTEAIAASLLGLLDPGDEVILFEPYYDSYRACVALAGATARFVTLRPPHFRLDADALAAALTPRTRVILVNSPHNPSGRVFDGSELEAIARVCRDRDLVALSDEVYEHLVFEGRHVSIASLPGMRERTIVMSSLGKTFSLTGWKIGWTLAPPELTAAVRSAHQFLTFATASPLQHGAVAALRSPSDYFEAFREAYRRRRAILIDGLEQVGFHVGAPEGTYFVLADHTPFGFDDDVTFCRYLIEHVGVAAIPPSAFYHRPEDGRTLVRFAFCKDEAMLEAAVERMKSRLRAV